MEYLTNHNPNDLCTMNLFAPIDFLILKTLKATNGAHSYEQ